VERANKQAAMERWAKDYVDRAFDTYKRNQAAINGEATADQPVRAAAQVTASGSAVVPDSEKSPAEKKKPASHIDMDDVRQQVREQIRKGFFPSGVPGSSTPPK